VRGNLAIALLTASQLAATLWAQNEAQPKTAPATPPADATELAAPSPTANESIHAVRSMEGHRMDPGPHMKLTALAPPQAGDQERAAQVLAAARRLSERYKDYKVALADGYQIFLPQVPQRQYHFTSYHYAFESALHFNPEQPTSLLYEKQGATYTFVGVMYSAPKNASEEELDARIPLSVAQWHAHVNLCLPPPDRKKEAWGSQPKFGLEGSIDSKPECEAAGGRFVPQIFGWMVHVYPLGQTPMEIWSADQPGGNQ
jgi:hypothetical protein